jgi:hypothetical protein
MVETQIVRELALCLPRVEERDHHGRPSFRVEGKIFATLWADERRAVVKLSPEEQAALVASEPVAFAPVPGAWGRKGWTSALLDAVATDDLRAALRSAWHEVAPVRSAAASWPRD